MVVMEAFWTEVCMLVQLAAAGVELLLDQLQVLFFLHQPNIIV